MLLLNNSLVQPRRHWGKDEITTVLFERVDSHQASHPQLLFIDYDLHHSSIHNIKWEGVWHKGKDEGWVERFFFWRIFSREHFVKSKKNWIIMKIVNENAQKKIVLKNNALNFWFVWFFNFEKRGFESKKKSNSIDFEPSLHPLRPLCQIHIKFGNSEVFPFQFLKILPSKLLLCLIVNLLLSTSVLNFRLNLWHFFHFSHKHNHKSSHQLFFSYL